MILDFDVPDGPLTESDYEAVHDARHPLCSGECDERVCLCPLACSGEAVEVAPGRFSHDNPTCIATSKEIYG